VALRSWLVECVWITICYRLISQADLQIPMDVQEIFGPSLVSVFQDSASKMLEME
jgi:hypothetical protein